MGLFSRRNKDKDDLSMILDSLRENIAVNGGRKDAEPIRKRAQKAAALVGAMVDAGRCDAAREVIMQWYSEELPSFAMGSTPEQARRNLEDMLDAGPLEQDKAVETWREIADDLLALTRS